MRCHSSHRLPLVNLAPSTARSLFERFRAFNAARIIVRMKSTLVYGLLDGPRDPRSVLSSNELIVSAEKWFLSIDNAVSKYILFDSSRLYVSCERSIFRVKENSFHVRTILRFRRGKHTMVRLLLDNGYLNSDLRLKGLQAWIKQWRFETKTMRAASLLH